MPSRDEQEFESKRQQIMLGALDAFADKGFEKATNKDIAQAAKINSPGLIYHYFKDKQDLFRQMLDHFAPAFQLLVTSEKQLMEQPPEIVLHRFALAMLQTLQHPTRFALFKVILGEALRNPMVAEIMGRVGPGRAFAFFSRYLQKQMDLGVVRQMPTAAAVRCFIGPLIGYVLSKDVLRLPDSDEIDAHVMAQTAVDIFLHGSLVVQAPTTSQEIYSSNE